MKRMNWLMFGVAIVVSFGVAASAVADESASNPKRRPGLTTTPPPPQAGPWTMGSDSMFKKRACRRASDTNCLI
jgi:hypothetical protein